MFDVVCSVSACPVEMVRVVLCSKNICRFVLLVLVFVVVIAVVVVVVCALVVIV